MRRPEKPRDKELSAKELADLKKSASLILAQTRMNFVHDFPFVGNVSMSLNIVPTRDANNPTAATDGNNIFFDISYLSELSENDRMFILGHEVYHNVMMHFLRTEGRDRELFNVATDLEVNQILHADGLVVPKEVLMPHMFNFPENRSAEDYYDMLIQNQMAQQKARQMSGSGQSGDSNDQPNNSNSRGNGSPIKGQFDRHVYNGDDPGSEERAKGQADKYGKVGKDDDFKPNMQPSEIEKIREIAIMAAQEMERTRGELPGHLKRLIGELLEPEVDWKEVLSQYTSRCVSCDPTWNRPNRRFAHQRIYLPSHEGKMLNIAIGLDTSGSTSGDMMKFLSEVKGIVSTFGNYSLDVIQCDYDIQSVNHFDESQPLDFDSRGLEISGGGGTRMKPVFDYIAVNDMQPDIIVMFTDGYIDDIPESQAPDAPVLWIVTGDGRTDFNFGTAVKFKG